MLKGLSITLGAWMVGALFLRVAVLQPEHCPAPTQAELRASAQEAADWIARSQYPDGTYVYEWNGVTGDFSNDYNAVRHGGVTMSLYHHALFGGDDSVLPAADLGLQWMIDNIERRDDWAALRLPGASSLKLGATSLMLASLELRRQATGDTQYDDLMRELARFTLVLQQPDGSFLNFFDLNTGAPTPGITSVYATGEAFWALAMLHRSFPGEGWDEPVWAVADYLALHRDEVEDFAFPPWADQWAAYGFAEMADWGLEEHHIEYVRSIAARFGLLVRSESQRRDSDYSYWTRGPGARAAGLGTWVEALNSLWRLSEKEPRLADLAPALADRAQCSAGILVDRQVTTGEAANYASTELARGAWFVDDATRMDDQQHALSGLIMTWAKLEGEDTQ